MSAPVGLVEELALERVAVVELAELRRAAFARRDYALAIAAGRDAAAARTRVAELELALGGTQVPA